MLSSEPTGPADGGTTLDHPIKGRVRIAFGARSDPGKVRRNNEDHFLVARLAKAMQVSHTSLSDAGATHLSDEEAYLMIVADGMGGAAAGERASALAVETVEHFVLNTLKWFFHLEQGGEAHALFGELRRSLEQADRTVVERARTDPSLHGMGTTLTMAYSVNRDLFVVHAGDSRAYLFRDGELIQLTSDHTLVQVLVDGGAISPEDAKKHRGRNIVTNVVGGPNEGVHAEIHKLTVEDGDRLLLCSDGLTEPVGNDQITEILARHDDPKIACDQLIEQALERGAPDNVTVVLARYTMA
jgi:protein phosphatase